MTFVRLAAGLSDLGRKRPDNEDALLLDDGLGLYAVADGMGGHQAGEIASRLVLDTIHSQLIAHGTPPDAQDAMAARRRLQRAVAAANQAVFERSLTDPACQGMGSTVAAVWLVGSALLAINVGDSPIFHLRGESMAQISVTHNLAAEGGSGVPRAAGQDARSPWRHVLTRAMGVGASVEADLCAMPLQAGDGIVIASDGLSDAVAAEEIAALARRFAPAEACRRLIDAANARGGEDNISVIVISLAAG